MGRGMDYIKEYEDLKLRSPISNENFEVKVISSVIDQNDINSIYKALSEKDFSFVQEATGQKVWHDVLSDTIKNKIKEKAQGAILEILDLDDMEYSVVNYSFKNGYTPQLFPHYDTRDSQRITFNVKIGENFKWGIVVENKTYHLNAGEAIILSGTQQQHWREKIEITKNDSVDMILCFFKYKEDKPLDEKHFEIMQSRTSFLQNALNNIDPFVKDKNE